MVATGIAFVVTERLKLEPAPIKSTHVTKLFSPTCGCNTSRAWVVFTLRRGEQVTLSIVDSHDRDREIRRLLDGADKPAGRLKATWNGRDELGRLAPNGNYRVRVYLANERRTIWLPNVIRLDTQAPEIISVAVNPRTISPDGDRHKDFLHIRYRVNERARILLFVDGKLTETTKLRASKSSKFDWGGRVDGRLRLGWHDLTLRAVDRAGNESAPTTPIPVRLRILRLRPGTVHIPARKMFRLAISTDRDVVRWRFAGRSGLAASRSLVLRAPAAPGSYRVIVRSGPYVAGARIIVS